MVVTLPLSTNCPSRWKEADRAGSLQPALHARFDRLARTMTAVRPNWALRGGRDMHAWESHVLMGWET